ncbi:hypothetical protein RG836_03580 [Pseudomonas sp. SZMC_28357]|uniref:hypothetical protein n=1 Tax=Pseudomonas sp. SZMC_28357 TaxID=3074380 RepID=UPI0028712AC1|nr:hypothetical protein [Pseudomonas sp. SZMC_28357]MDR9750514.1 hypothetical protein [Pseudomonas sp. SZMC_28357]
MANPYIEDDGAEFPINNCVQCGQTEYVAGFGETDNQPRKVRAATVVRGERAKFLPRVPAPSRK